MGVKERAASSRDLHGMFFPPEGDAGMDHGATTRFRLDRQFSPHQIESLAHADQAKTATIHRLGRVKADTSIVDGEVDFTAMT